MKRMTVIFFSILSIVLFFAVFTNAYAINLPESTISSPALRFPLEDDQAEKGEISLPSSLTIIEDNAFEGTAITSIELPDSVQTIGDFAFANIQTLRQIKIPDNTSYIGTNAFKGSNQVVLSGSSNGYARTWAKENGIPFALVAWYCAFNNTTQTISLTGEKNQLQQLLFANEIEKTEKAKPTGRMAGELSESRYEGCTAFHIQGRSPPMG